ncbi:MAG: hypothetical protein ABL914_12840 [Novosphingobium sp.]|uniref:hypothetical protein n=1 Tax=Novosphingobium sp. TaxID=1874826 RepID=UPI0032B93A3B
MADNRLIADIARRNGGKLLDAAIDTLLPADGAKPPAGKKTVLGSVAGAVAVRLATRSVPGAIVVGGAMLAKRLYDRRHAAKAPEKAKPKT